jgi:hypothetical protein
VAGAKVLPAVLAALIVGGSAVAAEPAQPPAKPSAGFAFEPKTQVDGAVLQVIFGERAVFRLDDGGQPVLDAVEKGQLALAHPKGEVTETFAQPDSGMMAAALDGSAEVQASTLKVWNHTGHPIQYHGMALVLHDQKLTPVPLAMCPVPAGGVRTQSWPSPIVAVGLSKFKTATAADLAQPACKKGK